MKLLPERLILSSPPFHLPLSLCLQPDTYLLPPSSNHVRHIRELILAGDKSFHLFIFAGTRLKGSGAWLWRTAPWSQRKGTGAPLGSRGTKSCYEPSSPLEEVWYLDPQSPWQFRLRVFLSASRRGCGVPDQVTAPAFNEQTFFSPHFF